MASYLVLHCQQKLHAYFSSGKCLNFQLFHAPKHFTEDQAHKKILFLFCVLGEYVIRIQPTNTAACMGKTRKTNEAWLSAGHSQEKEMNFAWLLQYAENWSSRTERI